tara:strand:- start:52 stop:450 length:399 start_codon:yes stop_codon:yes gene_type:complete
MAKISFDLVSPENLVFNDEVGMIIVPGKDGDFGILPGHSKVMSSLRPGRVMVYREDKNLLKSFFVSGGFVEVNPEKCIVLAESVDDISLLDKTAIQKTIENLEKSDDLNSKDQLIISNAKLDSMNSDFYKKI